MTDEEKKAKRAEYMKAYQLKNKEKRAKQNKAWRLANKEKIKANELKNKAKIAEQRKKRYEANKQQESEYHKEYYKTNREKLNANSKEYYLNNKETRNEYGKAHRLANQDEIKEREKAYKQTDAGIKSNRMGMWRFYGIKDVNDELYNYYMNCDNCEVCGKEFTETIRKCLDHDHDTGKFRYVLCYSCNDHDSWKNKIDVKDN